MMKIDTASLSAAGVYALVIGGIITLLTWFIRNRPRMVELKNLREEKIRGEGRVDLSECQRQIAAMRKDLDGVLTTVTNLKIELNSVLSAYRILEIEVEEREPQSIALKHARAILATAFAVAPSTEGMG